MSRQRISAFAFLGLVHTEWVVEQIAGPLELRGKERLVMRKRFLKKASGKSGDIQSRTRRLKAFFFAPARFLDSLSQLIDLATGSSFRISLMSTSEADYLSRKFDFVDTNGERRGGQASSRGLAVVDCRVPLEIIAM
ncbi:uncharacterized protein RSE6_12546 [Rhynchosporium secalis]|uniref:Uncharacterized protein n=1 Tax=Rhynchosporium secalis TaxID=38038 RepID=A0A1E1MQN0_RHYSE|nr:uncharacterized protein RSE6_12546 [Rhynchosporium secalis]